jgi:hypothetical protein
VEISVMPENDPGPTTARRRSDYTPDYTVASIGRRMRSAERHIARWRATFPVLPRADRQHLAELLLAEADQPGGAE